VLTGVVGKYRKPPGVITATVVFFQAWKLYGYLKRGRAWLLKDEEVIGFSK
jgi:hypothetical protein